MQDEFAAKVHERSANDNSPIGRDADDVLQTTGVVGLTVDRHHLKVVDVDVERVLLWRHIVKRPLLDGPQRDSLVDQVGVEQLAVDLVDGGLGRSQSSLKKMSRFSPTEAESRPPPAATLAGSEAGGCAVPATVSVESWPSG